MMPPPRSHSLGMHRFSPCLEKARSGGGRGGSTGWAALRGLRLHRRAGAGEGERGQRATQPPPLPPCRRSGAPPFTAVHADYQASAGDSSVLQRPLKSELNSSELRDVFGFPRDLKANYALDGMLGAGSFGVVRLATERATGRRYAVKTIPKVPKSGKATPRYLLKLQAEVDAMGQLGASLDAVYLKDTFEDDASVHLVMELCEGGSVLDRLKDGEYSERQVAHIMRAVLRFLSQCHSKGVVYRDVKPENFMLLYKDAQLGLADARAPQVQRSDVKGGGADGAGSALWRNISRAVGLARGQATPPPPQQQQQQQQQGASEPARLAIASPVKATDFGLSIRHRRGDPPLKSRSGTPAYMAPEVITQCYDEGADVWSAGIMMWQLLTGRFPFWDNVRECTLQQVWKSILSDRIDFNSADLQQVSPAARDLLRGMLNRDPALRLSAAEALRHPWLRSDDAASALPLRSSVVQRLQRFATYGHLKQLVLRLIADELSGSSGSRNGLDPAALPESAALVEALAALFRELDADASGSLSMDELVGGLERLGYRVSAAELEQLMGRVDTNQDGALQLPEFVAGLVDWGALQAEPQWGRWVALAFDRLDRNKDGYLSLASLEEMLGHSSDGSESGVSTGPCRSGAAAAEGVEADRLLEARRMLREADTNNDGRVSREEFAELLTASAVPDRLNQYDSRLKGMPADLASLDEELLTSEEECARPPSRGGLHP